MPPKTRQARPKPGATTARKPAARKTPAKRRKASRKRIQVTVKFPSLFTCKRCKKGYNLPWAHTCMIGFTPAQAAAARKNIALARKAKKRRWW